MLEVTRFTSANLMTKMTTPMSTYTAERANPVSVSNFKQRIVEKQLLEKSFAGMTVLWIIIKMLETLFVQHTKLHETAEFTLLHCQICLQSVALIA